MPFVNVNTFAPGDVVDADLIQENLDAIKAYLNGGVVAADLESKNEWIRTNHLVRGRFNPLNGQMKFISGLVAGNTFSVFSNELGLLPDAPTSANSTTNPDLVFQPNCSFDFYLPQDAYCMFQFYGSPISMSLAGTGTALDQFVWRIYVDDVEIPQTEFKTQFLAGTSARNATAFLNQYWADTLAEGTHTISIKGYAEAPYNIMTAWGISMESWNYRP